MSKSSQFQFIWKLNIDNINENTHKIIVEKKFWYFSKNLSPQICLKNDSVLKTYIWTSFFKMIQIIQITFWQYIWNFPSPLKTSFQESLCMRENLRYGYWQLTFTISKYCKIHPLNHKEFLHYVTYLKQIYLLVNLGNNSGTV